MQNDSGLVVQAAIERQGVALARGSLAALALRNGQLTRLFDVEVPVMYREGQDVSAEHGFDADGLPRRWAYWLVLPQRGGETPLRQAFVDWLRAEMAADAAAGFGPEPA
jgi:LysR family glycine cleavage system transcriptional activator